MCVLVVGCAPTPTLHTALTTQRIHHWTVGNHEALAAMPLWLFRATQHANAHDVRPRLSHTVSLGHAGDEPLTGGMSSDGTVVEEGDELQGQ